MPKITSITLSQVYAGLFVHVERGSITRTYEVSEGKFNALTDWLLDNHADPIPMRQSGEVDYIWYI